MNPSAFSFAGHPAPAAEPARAARPAPAAPGLGAGLADADAALRAQVQSRLASRPGWQPETSNVFVCQGQVVLQGLYASSAERRATRALAATVAGVRGVLDARVQRRDW